MKVFILLTTMLMATAAIASDNSQTFVFAGKLIQAGDSYQVQGHDGITKSGSFKTVKCQPNGTGLAVVQLSNGNLYEIEYAPWDVNCSVVRPTSR